MRTVRVNASKSYDIIIEAGILDKAGILAKKAAGGSIAAIVTDDIVNALYGERLENALKKSGFKTLRFVFPNGEASKNADSFIELLEFLAENGVSRTDTVFALGGGVVGDLAGFAAASFMRGVGFVQIPTTLLAAVDSSVGGKTGIDLKSGKNLAGAFYQPDLVLCDHLLLATLKPTVLRDGYAEVIKYGVIADSGLFEMLKQPVSARLEEVIARCVGIKRDIVCEDERECGVRKKLNFGHTVGHAIEKLSSYEIPHGHAVATGMAVIAKAAARKGLCALDCRDEIIHMIQRFGFETETGFAADSIAQVCLSDKKRSGGTITLVVPERIGACALLDMPIEELLNFIKLGIGER